MPKIRKKSFFRCRPPKTDFRFVIYTPASMIIKVDNKVIDSLKTLYLNEYYIL